MRVVAVGCGGFGRAFWSAYERSGARIVAVVDEDPAAVEAASVRWGVPAAGRFGRLDAPWAAAGAEAAVITVPHHLHAPAAHRALDAGLHVLCVKPLTDDFPEAVQLVEAAERRGRVLAVAQQLRYHPLIGALREVLAGGELGAVASVYLDFFIGASAEVRQWRRPMQWFLPLEGAIHHFDFLRAALGGSPAAVSAEAWNPPWSPVAGGACLAATFTWDTGCRVVYRGDWSARAPGQTGWMGRWRIEGDRGWATAAADRIVLRGGERPVEAVAPAGGDDLNLPELNARLFADFEAACQSGAPLAVAGRENLQSLGMVFGAIASAQAGRRVDLPLPGTLRAGPPGAG